MTITLLQSPSDQRTLQYKRTHCTMGVVKRQDLLSILRFWIWSKRYLLFLFYPICFFFSFFFLLNAWTLDLNFTLNCSVFEIQMIHTQIGRLLAFLKISQNPKKSPFMKYFDSSSKWGDFCNGDSFYVLCIENCLAPNRFLWRVSIKALVSAISE